MSDAKIGDMGLLAMLASGPILGGRLGEAEHTVCEDCENWTGESGYSSDGECTSDDMIYFRDTPKEDVRFARNGPPWPGCRGFKLRPGALGPLKRYAQAVRDKTNAALEGDKP